MYACKTHRDKKFLRWVSLSLCLFSLSPPLSVPALFKSTHLLRRLVCRAFAGDEQRTHKAICPPLSSLLNQSYVHTNTCVCVQAKPHRVTQNQNLFTTALHHNSQKNAGYCTPSPPNTDNCTLTRGSGRRRAYISPPLSYCTMKR